MSAARQQSPEGGGSSFMRGDLGLGRGLKPGALCLESENEFESSFTKYCPQPSHEAFASCDFDPRDRESPQAEFPSFAGVQYGTSLRQHRHLYEVSRKGRTATDVLRKKSKAVGPEGDCNHSCSDWSNERTVLDAQLRTATEELDVLHNELEACQSHLASKYRAIKILQHQIAIVNSKYQENEDKIKVLKRDMEKEVNSLQFELDVKSQSLRQQEESWSEKYNRVSRENTVLLSTLQARNAESRRLHAENLGLIRERDELLARMDANERLRYEQRWTPKHDPEYLQHALPDQLAVLGACLCRGSKTEPCQCARIAAILTKENGVLRDEMDRLKQKLVESVLVSDAFRKAFDEQLQCNSAMLRNMTDTQKIVKEGQSRQKKLFWRRKSDTEAFVHHPVQVQYGLSSLPVTRSFEEEDHSDHLRRTVGLQVSQPIPDSSSVFEDLVMAWKLGDSKQKPRDVVNLVLGEYHCSVEKPHIFDSLPKLQDKSEALAHQRLVSKLLAQKTHDLEKAVKQAESLLKH